MNAKWMETLLVLICFTSACRTSQSVESRPMNPDPALVETIGFLLQTDEDKTERSELSQDERKRLKQYKFMDSLSTIHPRFYDRIKNVERREIERFYFDYSGNIPRSEVLVLSEEEFWRPIKVVAQYYQTFKRLPSQLELFTPVLQGAIDSKLKGK